MDALDRFVAGRPAPFATAGERPWRETLFQKLVDLTPDSEATLVALEFTVAGTTSFPRGPDLDNLCEPVFSVLAGRLGWFGGSRTRIAGFRAGKHVGDPQGCHIRASREAPEGTGVVGRELLAGIWPGPLPRGGRDAPFAQWVAESRDGELRPGSAAALALTFGPGINLGDIASGRLKNVIDGLHPVLGGRAGAPRDDAIVVIEVRRTADSGAGEVRVELLRARRLMT